VEKCQGIRCKFKDENTEKQQKSLPHKGAAMLQRQPDTRHQAAGRIVRHGNFAYRA